MGKVQSKEIEEEQINVVVPVNAPHLASDKYEVHQYHSGTVKIMCLILLITFMTIIICVIAIKRLCKNMRVIANPQVVVAKKHQFPDI